jgi:hypothetical protein
MFHAKSERGNVAGSLFSCRTLAPGTHNRSQCYLVRFVPMWVGAQSLVDLWPHDCEALASGKKSGWPLIL